MATEGYRQIESEAASFAIIYQTPPGSPMQPVKTVATNRSRPAAPIPIGRQRQRQPQQQSKVRRLPQPQPLPTWLRSLVNLQRAAMLLFVFTFSSSALVYGLTAYDRSTWKNEHKELQKLQRQELQQANITENLKHKLAEDAEHPNSGFEDPKPEKTISISPAVQRQPRVLNSEPSKAPVRMAAGY